MIRVGSFPVGTLGVSFESVLLLAAIVVCCFTIWLFYRVSRREEFGLEVERGWVWKMRVEREERAVVPFFWPMPVVQRQVNAWWRAEVERVMAAEVEAAGKLPKRRTKVTAKR